MKLNNIIVVEYRIGDTVTHWNLSKIIKENLCINMHNKFTQHVNEMLLLYRIYSEKMI